MKKPEESIQEEKFLDTFIKRINTFYWFAKKGLVVSHDGHSQPSLSQGFLRVGGRGPEGL